MNTPIDKMTNAEVNDAIAREVMGWTAIEGNAYYSGYWGRPEQRGLDFGMWNPIDNIAQAFEAADEVGWDCIHFVLESNGTLRCHIVLGAPQVVAWSDSGSQAEALSRAVLAASRAMKEAGE